MTDLLKNIFSPEFYDALAEVLAVTLPDFDALDFKRRILVPEFENLELKQRMTHTTRVLHRYLGDDFATAAGSICKLIDALRARELHEQVIEFMFLPDYIETYGIDDYDRSVGAFEFITQFTSCELAVRPFIISYAEPMMAQMLDWSRHPHHMVRRLASEGSRPRLPWAMALPDFKRDPKPIIPILENLKQDESETVRRSVANNLNDISKDNPQVTIAIARRWLGRSVATDALVKHGCRTLLKQGHPEVLAMFGFDNSGIELEEFTVQTPAVVMGDRLEFSFRVNNRARISKKLRIEYAIYLLKKNGQLAKKVFKISEREIAAGACLEVVKQHRFRPITTRVYYSGRHQLAAIVNGVESERLDFELSV